MQVKNIYFLTSTFPELSEQFIVNQITGLIDAGIVPNIISLNAPDLKVTNRNYSEYGLLQRTSVVNIPDSILKRYCYGALLLFKLILLSPKKAVRALNFKKYNRAVFSLKTIYVLNFLRKEKIDILHCHFGPNGVLGAFLKDVGIVSRLIVTFHGSDINSYPKRYGVNVYQHLYQQTDLITANTNFTKSKIVQNGCPDNKIVILPVGLKIDDYPMMNKGNRRSRPFELLTVARLEEKKGHIYVLHAIKKIIETKGGDIKYHLVGSGSWEDKLKKEVDALKIANCIFFHGFCNRDEIFSLYENANLFILASVTASNGDMEGQGLVLQEAQAVGLPVLTTWHNGIPDGVKNDVSGFLVPEKDSEALAEKILYFMENPHKSHEMGKAGRAFVQGKYDIPILTKQLLGYYEMVMKDSQKP